jgi:signal peptidase I
MRSSPHVALPPVARPRVLRERLRLPFAIAKLAALLGVAGVLLWFGLPQAIGGRAEWVMVSGTSMLPRFQTGDLVLVERRSSYHVGEVVAYRIHKGEIGAGDIVIHRITGGNGRTGWTLQGDNRTAPDLWHPTNQDVLGAKELRIPDAWFVLRVFHMPVLLALFAAFGVFLWIAFGAGGEAEPDGAGGGRS